MLFVGNAEWDDIGHTTLRILLKSPEQLASEIYNWASKVQILGTVFTVYELHSGDEHEDSGTRLIHYL